MKRGFLSAVVALVAFGVVLVVAPLSGAGNDATCSGTLPPGTYDNVTVPAGSSCTLNSSHVIQGNLKMEPGALTVDVRNTSVGGNVEGDSYDRLDLHSVTVGGSVKAKKAASNN
jgi:hypothetical protein